MSVISSLFNHSCAEEGSREASRGHDVVKYMERVQQYSEKVKHMRAQTPLISLSSLW